MLSSDPVMNGHTTPITMDENTPTTPKKIILHLGDKIRHNDNIHRRLDFRFHIIRPELWDRERPAFIQHLKDRTWGDFSAIMKPFWSTGGEMGCWDRELIELLPSEMKVMARAGAGYDSVDVDALAEKGKSTPRVLKHQQNAEHSQRALQFCTISADSPSQQEFSTATVVAPPRNPSPTAPSGTSSVSSDR